MYDITIKFDHAPTPSEIAAKFSALASIYGGKANAVASDPGLDDAGPKPATKPGKKAKVEEETFDLDSDEGEADEQDDADEIELDEPETKEPTLKDVIKACNANKKKAALVFKKLGINTVHAIKPKQFAAVMKAVA